VRGVEVGSSRREIAEQEVVCGAWA